MTNLHFREIMVVAAAVRDRVTMYRPSYELWSNCPNLSLAVLQNNTVAVFNIFIVYDTN